MPIIKLDKTSINIDGTIINEDGTIVGQIIDYEPIRHGRWIYTGFMEVKCSECSETFHELESTNYCPNCGAKMDEEGKDD